MRGRYEFLVNAGKYYICRFHTAQNVVAVLVLQQQVLHAVHRA